ncbi:ABC-type amino acid transport substrate-binding protein [Streptomyces sp. V4I23]|nr:hypothetical protein [Streptomyces sp. V4I23]MDQ1011670.1 ABC-type amino acid transport substrate-binding protein [Streptomyces sp. V4I23]
MIIRHLATAAAPALGLLTACGTGDPATDVVEPRGNKVAGINLGPDQNRVRTTKNEAAAAKLPEAVRKRGTLTLGVSNGAAQKDSGLVEAYGAAIDKIIRDGSYAKVLKRWGLTGEAVEKSEINPPGLPRPKK